MTAERLEIQVTNTERVEIKTSPAEVVEVGVQGPPGPNFLINPTPEEEEAAPNGTVILTTTEGA